MSVIEFESLLYEVDQGRARITMNRPKKRNALSFQLISELHEALWEADNDKEVHGVVLRGAGKSFCAGYDLAPEPGSGPPRGVDPDRKYRGYRSFEDDTWQLERSQRLRMALFDMHKPVIAQVQGHCLAGGTDIAVNIGDEQEPIATRPLTLKRIPDSMRVGPTKASWQTPLEEGTGVDTRGLPPQPADVIPPMPEPAGETKPDEE